ncbi:transposase, partial [Mycetohabitans sp. B6]
RQNSSGGKVRLGGISKRGDVYLRTLLIHGARSVISSSRHLPERLHALLTRRPTNERWAGCKTALLPAAFLQTTGFIQGKSV